MRKQRHDPSFRLPEQIITDRSLSISARELAITIFSHVDPNGRLCMSQRRLASLSGLCRDTVRRAAQELVDAGYISIVHRRAHWDRDSSRYVKRSNLYFCTIPNKCYVLVSYRLLRRSRVRSVRGASLLVLVYLRSMMGRHGRCWPSVSKIAQDTGLALSTVHIAINLLESLSLIVRQHCIKRNGAYSSYASSA